MRPSYIVAIARGTADEHVHRALCGPDGAALAAAVVRHGLAGQLLASVPGAASLPAEVSEPLLAARGRAVERHLRSLLDLAVLDRAFASAGITWLAVKGTVLAETLYPSIELRPHGDLDVLVTPQDLAAALEVLEAAGADVIDRNWHLLRSRLAGQLHLELPGGTLCDLHWDLTHHPESRRAFHLPAEELLARASTVQVGGRAIRTTDPVDTILHLATHACVSGLGRLIWLRDLDLLARGGTTDWNEVVSRARSSGTRLTTAVALRCTRTILGTPVPRAVVRELDPVGAWSRLTAAALHRSRSLDDPSPRPGAVEALARSTRDTTWRSARDLAQRSRGSVQERLRGEEPPTGAELILRPAGDATDRAAFLAEVRAEGTGAPARLRAAPVACDAPMGRRPGGPR